MTNTTKQKRKVLGKKLSEMKMKMKKHEMEMKMKKC